MDPASITSVLVRAIKHSEVLEVTYADSKVVRIVHPHALGVSAEGVPILLGWQAFGASLRGRNSGWKSFIVDRITHATSAGRTFDGRRDDYDPSWVAFDEILFEVEP